MKRIQMLLFIVFIVALSAVFSACQGENIKQGQQAVVFPVYQEENPENLPYIDQINSTPKFQVKVDLPEGWRIGETPNSGKVDIPGSFYSTVLVYKGEEPAAYVGFNQFEPYQEEIPQEDYYKTVYPELRLSSMFVWDPYTTAAVWENGEAGVAEIWYKNPQEAEKNKSMAEIPEIETVGVLAYNKELGVFVGIAFVPGTMELEQSKEIAKTISIQPA